MKLLQIVLALVGASIVASFTPMHQSARNVRTVKLILCKVASNVSFIYLYVLTFRTILIHLGGSDYQSV